MIGLGPKTLSQYWSIIGLKIITIERFMVLNLDQPTCCIKMRQLALLMLYMCTERRSLCLFCIKKHDLAINVVLGCMQYGLDFQIVSLKIDSSCLSNKDLFCLRFLICNHK